MRFSLAIAGCFGLALVAMTGQASAQGQSESESLSRLVPLTEEAADRAAGVRILRGSAAPPRAVAATQPDGLLGPGQVQVVAGERFWVFNQDTRKLASCRNTPTFNVGERELDCTFGTFSRFRRTFGDNFRH